MNKEKIKQAFQKVKQDNLDLQSQISMLTREIQEIKRTLTQTENQTDRHIIQTDRHIIQTVPQEEGGSKPQNSTISTRNKGVQTDRQTNRHTHRQTEKFALENPVQDPITKIGKVSEVISSLDALKKDLRKQFKQLTQQEMLVYSTTYQLTNEAIDVDYSLLSEKTGLSESSIRDYIRKIIKKNIPLEKTKENNKRIVLTIPPEFKRIASLDTITALRNL
ncbi:MAG: hypothetical protein KJ718_04370 [Nanoarchaeota archaeon]|nr:hypothetical protein [Nanoarchaeota archaeon]MBU1051764.1 hypothetical protein [Nanoarchaeota archaeon]MBU1988355.1 hypothetical protein [Nanoarchaeota archaeon]